MKFERGDITATPVNTIEKLKKRYNLEGEETTKIDINSIADALKPIFLDFYYPIGSIYTSTDSTDPSDLFGGTWTQIKDTFLLSAGDDYTAGDTGGEAEHILLEAEMPKHKHLTYKANTGYNGFPYQTLSFSEYGFIFSITSGCSNSGSTNYTGHVTTDADGPTDVKGGDTPHNNMPPYLVVYVWERTA